MNGCWSVGTIRFLSLVIIFTGNFLSGLISHVAMHVAAVLHGLETVMQLTSHY